MSHKDLPKEVKEHAARVAKLSRLSARAFGKDERKAYLAGLFHDEGKQFLPPELFAGGEITDEEYEQIKTHAVKGYKDLKSHMEFSGLCAGLHHRMGSGDGYGVTLEDIPEDISFSNLKKLLDIATIVSIADFIDAYNTRTTSVHLPSPKRPLVELLTNKYPAESVLIKIMLELASAMYSKRRLDMKIAKITVVAKAGCKAGCKCTKPCHWSVTTRK